MKNHRSENTLSETADLKRLRALANYPTMFCRLLFRWCACLAACALGCAAAAAETVRPFDIPAGDAAETLKLAARQGGLEIAFFAETVRGVQTPALRGAFSTRDALARLLAGTGLSLVGDASAGTVTIRREGPGAAAQDPSSASSPTAQNSALTMKSRSLLSALAGWLALGDAANGQIAPAPAAGPAEETVTMSVFEVSSKADKGYLSTSSISAGRVNTPVANIPQSLIVLTEELIRDQAPLNLSDVLRFAPGVNVSEAASEAVTIRGVTVAIPLVDGFRSPRTFPSEQGDIERVEVLLGPASVLYGNVFGVGGIVNRITKKATFVPQSSLQLQLRDQESLRRVVADTGGPVAGSKKVAYRMIVAVQRQEFLPDFADLNRITVMPKLRFKLPHDFVFDVAGEYSHQTGNYFNGDGIRRDYWLNGAIIRVPDASNPAADLTQANIIKRQGTFALAGRINEHWAVRAAGLGGWVQTKSNTIPVAAVLTGNGTLLARNNGGNVTARNRGVANVFFQADAAGNYVFESFKLKPLLGIEYSFDSDGTYVKQATTALPAFNVFTPDYSARLPVNYLRFANPRSNTFGYAAFGLVEVTTLKDRLIFNAGDRVTDWRLVSRNAGQSTTTVFSNRNTTYGPVKHVPRYGAVFKVTPDVSVYYGYSEAFQPRTAANPDGSVLPPVEGVQHDFGVKALLFGGRVSLTASKFKLDQLNNAQADPTRPGFNIASGAQRTEGWDASLVATLLPGWQLIAGYAHAKGKVIASVTPTQVGLALTGFPGNSASLWTRYALREGPLKGLSFGAGTVYGGQSQIVVAGATTPPRFIPAYQTYDALVSYDWNKKIRLQLNLRNLTDRRYYPSGNANSLGVGEARTIGLTTTYWF